MDFVRRLDNAKKAIDDADYILIGAGAGFSAAAGIEYSGKRFEENFQDFIEKYGVQDMYSATFYPYETQEEKWAHWIRHVYVNRELVKDTPDLAAPIVYQGQVIAVVQLFGLNFSQWSLYQQNLLSITMRLVSASMGRAYQYEAEAQDKRYYSDTRILRNEAFQEIIQELRERRKLQGDLPIGTLKVQRGELDFKRLDELCGRMIRNEDFIGELEGEVYILLPDADDSVCNMVQERLARDGVVTVEGETVV